MTKEEALELALKALERGETKLRWEAITAIKEALAQPDHGWTPERIAGMASLKALQDSRFEPKELNFCQRCGKRLGLGGIHTCTPPRGNT